MRAVAVGMILVVAGCARPQPLNPYVPPETQYSAGGTIAAVGGVMALSAGASMMDKGGHSTTQKAGAATAAGGLALLGAAIADALEVKKEREKFVNLYNAFIRNYYGSPAPDLELRTPAPPPPDLPFELPVEDSPLNGKDAKP